MPNISQNVLAKSELPCPRPRPLTPTWLSPSGSTASLAHPRTMVDSSYTIDSTSTDTEDDSDDDPSTTYIEFNDADHPLAYSVVADTDSEVDGAVNLRNALGRDNMYVAFADTAVPLARTLSQGGDPVPLLDFADPSGDELAEWLDDNPELAKATMRALKSDDD